MQLEDAGTLKAKPYLWRERKNLRYILWMTRIQLRTGTIYRD
jgi:hypothetical protein